MIKKLTLGIPLVLGLWPPSVDTEIGLVGLEPTGKKVRKPLGSAGTGGAGSCANDDVCERDSSL